MMNNNLLAGVGDVTNPLFSGTTYQTLIQSPEGGSGFLELILPKIIGLLFVFGSLVFFFMFVWGAISWILAAGDKAHVEAAKGRITSALIGVVLLFSSFAIVALVETFFGVNILTIDIGPLVIQ